MWGGGWLSAECLVVCSPTPRHSNPGRPRLQMGRPRCKGVKPLTVGTSPREDQGPGRRHGPNLWPARFCAGGTLMPQEGHSRTPQRGAELWGRGGGNRGCGVVLLGVCSIWRLQGRGLRPASAWRSRRRPHPGSQPKSASPPGNSRLPPLPGLGPATTHMPTPSGCPAPPSKSSRTR